MERFTALTWSWLQILTKPRYEALRQAFGSLDAALPLLDRALLAGLGVKDETAARALRRLVSFSVREYEERLKGMGAAFLSIEDDAYPGRLREIGDPPLFLYYRGDSALLAKPSIGVVGTREMSRYGERVVGHFVPAFVASGLVTVSGLAMGIDAAVARQTMASGGKTIAVLGHGLQEIFPPSNADLAEEIVTNGGLLVSEFPLDTVPGRYTFPARNRIIAGLTLGTVVLEAGEGSGALITSDLALDYGREAFAVPGDIFHPGYAGCHGVIATGQAKLVTEPRQVLSDIGVVPSAGRAAAAYEPRNAEEGALLAALTALPQTVTDLVAKSQLQTRCVNAALTALELCGAAKKVGGGEWVKI